MKNYQMNFRLQLCVWSAVVSLTACSDDDDFITETNPESIIPQIEMTVPDDQLTMDMGDSLIFEAVNLNEAVYTQEWKLADSVVSTASSYYFNPASSGTFELGFYAANKGGDFQKEYRITVAPKIRPITEESSAYVTELIQYLPAPGQYINKNLGNIESAESVLGGNDGMVSLGAWGGSVIYAFDHTVLNADESDIILYGNAFQSSAEPGVIWVMQDENANGLADDTWYQIKGSAHELEGSAMDYSITYFKPASDTENVAWEDNLGNTGVVETNQFHTQPYYPQWIEGDSYTVKGTLLSDVNIDKSNPSYITSAGFDYGYADNTAGGDRIDLADAVDAEGNPVLLEGIDFIKIQTGIQANLGWLGELSTEVSGVADLSLLEE